MVRPHCKLPETFYYCEEEEFSKRVKIDSGSRLQCERKKEGRENSFLKREVTMKDDF
jgi:hypothetical protein